jgi:hypothetical protein
MKTFTHAALVLTASPGLCTGFASADPAQANEMPRLGDDTLSGDGWEDALENAVFGRREAAL